MVISHTLWNHPHLVNQYIHHLAWSFLRCISKRTTWMQEMKFNLKSDPLRRKWATCSSNSCLVNPVERGSHIQPMEGGESNMTEHSHTHPTYCFKSVYLLSKCIIINKVLSTINTMFYIRFGDLIPYSLELQFILYQALPISSIFLFLMSSNKHWPHLMSFKYSETCSLEFFVHLHVLIKVILCA